MAQSDLNTMGAVIREARGERGSTQTQLASALDTSQSAVNRAERGGQNPLPRVAAQVARVMWKAGITRGAADVMYSPNWGIMSACASSWPGPRPRASR